jgi:hypothetical protein
MFFCWIFLFRSYVAQICSALQDENAGGLELAGHLEK